MASAAGSRSWGSDLGGQGRADPSLSQSHQRAPWSSRREQPDPRRVGALRGGAQPGESRSPGSLWDAGGETRGAPGKRTGERGGPALPQGGAFSLRTASRGAGTTSPPTPTPGRALLGSPGLRHPNPNPRMQHPSSSIRLLPTPCLGVSLSLPHLFSAPRKSLAPAGGPSAPTHPAGSGAEAPGARGSRGWRRERGAPHSGPRALAAD